MEPKHENGLTPGIFKKNFTQVVMSANKWKKQNWLQLSSSNVSYPKSLSRERYVPFSFHFYAMPKNKQKTKKHLLQENVFFWWHNTKTVAFNTILFRCKPSSRASGKRKQKIKTIILQKKRENKYDKMQQRHLKIYISC